MDDHIAIAEKLIKKADKRLNRLRLFSSKQKDVAKLLDQAANSYKLAKSWDKAITTYSKLADHHLDKKAAGTASVEAAAAAFVEAAHCYDITSVHHEAIDCIKKVADILHSLGSLNPTTTCYEKATQLNKEIAELYETKMMNTKEAAIYYEKAAELYYQEFVEKHETEKNIEKAMHLFEKAAELFLNKELTVSASQCYEKAAQLAAQIKQYNKGIKIFENIATLSLNHNLLMEAKKHFFNAGVCRLCQGDDVVAMDISIMQYVEMYPNFPETKECKFLISIKAPLVHGDAAKFSDAVKALQVVDLWTAKLLSRVKEKLKAGGCVKTRWSTNKVADLTSDSLNTASGDGVKQRKMCTDLPRSQTVMHRSLPTGSKLTWSSSRIGMNVAPVNEILQKGLTSLKRSLSMAKR